MKADLKILQGGKGVLYKSNTTALYINFIVIEAYIVDACACRRFPLGSIWTLQDTFS